jgi:hypothetical protein
LAYLSDMNLRAVLTVLIARSGGEVTVTNEELYDAMMAPHAARERFLVEETDTGIRITILETEGNTPRSS